tara:strand:- start:113 stop:724 length:612 start_codon:yes stop_codon:yes gene_type:complete
MTVEYLIEQVKYSRQLIFDLDNTIYLETEFLFKVYNEISKRAINENPKIIYEFLKKTFLKNGRKNLFNKLETAFPQELLLLEKSLQIMRNYQCDSCINILPWFRKFLSKMNDNFIIKIITNGDPHQQINKIKSINFFWPKHLIEVVTASSYEPKPNTESFYHLKDVKKFISPIYVGDSLIDQEFCKNLNIEFYDIRKIIKVDS